jgi:peptide chain release factor 1
MRITCTEERSQIRNRDKAIQVLRAKLYEINSIKRSPLTAEKCSEIIRIYDRQNNYICDRRLPQNFSLTDSLEWALKAIIQSYISQQQQGQLAELANSPDTAEIKQY